MNQQKKDMVEIALKRGVRANVHGISSREAISEALARDDIMGMLKRQGQDDIDQESEAFKKALNTSKRIYLKCSTTQQMADIVENRLSVDAQKGIACLPGSGEPIDAYPGLAECFVHVKNAFLRAAAFENEELPVPLLMTTDKEFLESLRILDELEQKKVPDEIVMGDMTMKVDVSDGQIRLSTDKNLDHYGRLVMDDMNLTINQARMVRQAQKAHERKMAFETGDPAPQM